MILHRISELEKQLQRKAKAEKQLEHQKMVNGRAREGGGSEGEKEGRVWEEWIVRRWLGELNVVFHSLGF